MIYWTPSGCQYQPITPGASATCNVQCPLPTGETIASFGWHPTALTAHLWQQTLLPTSVSWIGRQIREVHFDGPSDSCWYSGSEFDPAGSLDPTPHTLDFEGYFDQVGWIHQAVTFYRVERPARGLPMPCGFLAFQSVQMACSGSWTTFTSHVLQGTIGVSDVQSNRGDNVAGRSWP